MRLTIFILLVSAAALGQDILNKVAGTWRLNPEKSVVKGDKPEEIFKVEKTGSNQFHTEWMSGGKVTRTVDHVCDGNEHDRKSNFQTGMRETCDPKTFTIVTKRDGKQSMHLTTHISADGKTMTRTRRIQDRQGRPQEDVFVYERQ